MLAAAPEHRIPSRTAGHDDNVAPRLAPQDEELAIVRRSQHQPQDFAPLYERYVDAVFGYCYRRTSDRELAADLTHQIFAKVLTAVPAFSHRPNGGSFRSWLFSIAHNLVVDTHRLRRETTSLDSGTIGGTLSDRSRSPEEHAIASEQGRALTAAMAELTDGQ